jgi:tryptophan-rich sensory protein
MILPVFLFFVPVFKMSIKASDVLVGLSPILIGFGSAWLLTPRKYVQCGSRPKIQPPGWVFGVAWTVLYILVGIAAFLAWRRSGRKLTRGLLALGIALLVLMAWWVVFTNTCMPSLAFATIVPSTGLVIVATALLWADGDRLASCLTVPLVLWMCFASLLSFLSSSSPSPSPSSG